MLKSEPATDITREAIALAEMLGKLKKLKRTGWINHSIPLPESVADHSYGVGLLALLLGKYFNVDTDKAVRMALLHDLGEAVIGDIITQRGDNVLSNESDKLQTERSALLSLLKDIGSEDYIELFDEYLEKQTPEAQFIHQLDKLEMAFQAHQYERDQGIQLEEFMVNAKKHITNDTLRAIFDTTLAERYPPNKKHLR
jgi:putative hydrolase of HD superfamily